MRSSMEAGGFEVFASGFQKRRCPRWRRWIGAKQAIDIVDAEANALHVEGLDGP